MFIMWIVESPLLGMCLLSQQWQSLGSLGYISVLHSPLHGQIMWLLLRHIQKALQICGCY